MYYVSDPDGEASVDPLPDRQRVVCHELAETIKRRVQLLEMFRRIIAVNRAGGWRRLELER